jgi:hypothetical protein
MVAHAPLRRTYSPNVGEGEFSEVELPPSGVLGSSLVETTSGPQQTPAERLTPPSEGRQDVLGTAVLAFREPLAQLIGDRSWHAIALEPAEQLLLAGGKLHPSR